MTHVEVVKRGPKEGSLDRFVTKITTEIDAIENSLGAAMRRTLKLADLMKAAQDAWKEDNAGKVDGFTKAMAARIKRSTSFVEKAIQTSRLGEEERKLLQTYAPALAGEVYRLQDVVKLSDPEARAKAIIAYGEGGKEGKAVFDMVVQQVPYKNTDIHSLPAQTPSEPNTNTPAPAPVTDLIEGLTPEQATTVVRNQVTGKPLTAEQIAALPAKKAAKIVADMEAKKEAEEKAEAEREFLADQEARLNEETTPRAERPVEVPRLDTVEEVREAGKPLEVPYGTRTIRIWAQPKSYGGVKIKVSIR